jgi:hypothetical protein
MPTLGGGQRGHQGRCVSPARAGRLKFEGAIACLRGNQHPARASAALQPACWGFTSSKGRSVEGRFEGGQVSRSHCPILGKRLKFGWRVWTPRLSLIVKYYVSHRIPSLMEACTLDGLSRQGLGQCVGAQMKIRRDSHAAAALTAMVSDRPYYKGRSTLVCVSRITDLLHNWFSFD